MDRERQREGGVGWTGRDRERGWGRVDRERVDRERQRGWGRVGRERQREDGVGWTGRDRERVG